MNHCAQIIKFVKITFFVCIRMRKQYLTGICIIAMRNVITYFTRASYIPLLFINPYFTENLLSEIFLKRPRKAM